MRWDQDHQSSNVEDRRGERLVAGGGNAGNLLSLAFMLFGRGKFGKVAAVALVGFALYQGYMQTHPRTVSAPVAQQGGAPDAGKAFVSFVLDDTQAVFAEKLKSMGKSYTPARLVLYTQATRSGCGVGQASTGPFYCPVDARVYLDLSFFNELSRRFGAPGDFAQAYVIAHEVGHHVQNLLGASAATHEAERRDPARANQYSVALELQADCYAGVWAQSAKARSLLEMGDVEEALGAATAVGDDTLQKKAQGTVTPETWTHGSSKERVAWFQKGAATGDLKACATGALTQ